MQTETRRSYGVISVFKDSEAFQFLVVRQNRLGRTYWSFAKGTPEQGETELETAIRETAEEVGIQYTDINEQVTFDEHYTFVDRGTQVQKTTTYFLGFCTSKEIKLQEEEIETAAWLTADEVEKRLTYPATKELFQRVRAYLGV